MKVHPYIPNDACGDLVVVDASLVCHLLCAQKQRSVQVSGQAPLAAVLLTMLFTPLVYVTICFLFRIFAPQIVKFLRLRSIQSGAV